MTLAGKIHYYHVEKIKKSFARRGRVGTALTVSTEAGTAKTVKGM